MPNPRIVSNPQILGGKPIIDGTRISVELILERLGSGMTTQDILKDYPHLTSNQIETAIAYAKKLIPKKKLNPDNKAATTLYTYEVPR